MTVLSVAATAQVTREPTEEESCTIKNCSTLVEQQGATIAYEVGEQTVSEGAGYALVCVVLKAIQDGLARPVDFTITTDEEKTLDFQFPVGSEVGARRCLNVSIVDNHIIEHPLVRPFLLAVTNDNDVVEKPVTYTLIIEDDDGATISFEVGAQTVPKSAGYALVCVVLEDIQDGLYRHVDFTITSETTFNYRFTAGSDVGTRRCLNVSIADDDIIESPQVRIFILAVTNSNDFVRVFEHILIIEDDDGVEESP